MLIIILSMVLSLSNFLINMEGLAIFPTAYLVLGLLARITLTTVSAITDGEDAAPGLYDFVCIFATAFAKL